VPFIENEKRIKFRFLREWFECVDCNAMQQLKSLSSDYNAKQHLKLKPCTVTNELTRKWYTQGERPFEKESWNIQMTSGVPRKPIWIRRQSRARS
jgi:hypothetical protein